MNLTQMHVMFRQFAQQMGMQNVRAILPEQIDLLLNTSISDTVNQIIQTNIGVSNDRVVTDNSKIGQVNALRTLYKVNEVKLVGKNVSDNQRPENRVTTTPESGKYFSKTFTHESENDFIGKFTSTAEKLGIKNKMFWVDFSINYTKPADNITLDNSEDFTTSSFTTNYFPVRLIDDAYLADCLNDFVLKPSLRSPILTIYDNTFDLYIDKVENGVLDNGLIPYNFRCAYIAAPNKVKYTIDTGVLNEECDLPENLHPDIVKHAVELYQLALSGNMATEQARQQRAQQERARNNNRNEND